MSWKVEASSRGALVKDDQGREIACFDANHLTTEENLINATGFSAMPEMKEALMTMAEMCRMMLGPQWQGSDSGRMITSALKKAGINLPA